MFFGRFILSEPRSLGPGFASIDRQVVGTTGMMRRLVDDPTLPTAAGRGSDRQKATAADPRGRRVECDGVSCAERSVSDTAVHSTRQTVQTTLDRHWCAREGWSNQPEPTPACQRGWFNHPPHGGRGVILAGSDSSRRHRCVDSGWFGPSRADTEFSIPTGSDSSRRHSHLDSGWFRQFEPARRSRFWLVRTGSGRHRRLGSGSLGQPAPTSIRRLTLVQTARAGIPVSE